MIRTGQLRRRLDNSRKGSRTSRPGLREAVRLLRTKQHRSQ